MTAISPEELYGLLRAGVEQCTSKALEQTDEVLAYTLFEEFDVVATSFLHDESLARLLEPGLISHSAKRLAGTVRAAWMDLQMTRWELAEVRTDPRWLRFFGLCDELLSSL